MFSRFGKMSFNTIKRIYPISDSIFRDSTGQGQLIRNFSDCTTKDNNEMEQN